MEKVPLSSFYNTGVILTVIALLYILYKYECAYLRNVDINTYSAHVYDYTLNSSQSGIKLPRYLYIHIRTTWLLYIVHSYYLVVNVYVCSLEEWLLR